MCTCETKRCLSCLERDVEILKGFLHSNDQSLQTKVQINQINELTKFISTCSLN